MRKRTIENRILKLWEDGVGERFLQLVIEILLPHYHSTSTVRAEKEGLRGRGGVQKYSKVFQRCSKIGAGLSAGGGLG